MEPDADSSPRPPRRLRRMSEVVEGFLACRRPFLAQMPAVVRSRGLEAEATTRMDVEANPALDPLTVATMRAHILRQLTPPGAGIER